MAPSKTNYLETQQDELSALQSIYMDDFHEEETKTGAWNKALDRQFSIKLRATHGGDQGGLVLKACLPPTYPKSLPRLSLSFGPDVRDASKKEAQALLTSRPNSLLGSEMIFEIASSLQDILDRTWVDPSHTVALDEERAAKDADLARAEEQYRRQLEQQKQQAEVEEERLLQELYNQRKDPPSKHTINAPGFAEIGPDNGVVPPDIVRFEGALSIRLSDGRAITAPAVHRKVKYRQGPVCGVCTVEPIGNDVGDPIGSEEPFLLLKECHIPLNDGNDSIRRLVQNLELKLERFVGLSPHQSILKPLNYRIQRTINSKLSDGWTIQVLMELAERRSLRDFLDIAERLDVKMLRAWSIQLIEGLQYYHRHGIAHADLHPGNVLLQRDHEAERGNKKITIAKLSDAGYQRDLHFLKHGAHTHERSTSWTAPELLNAGSSVEVMLATDIWDFGRCFLQMAFGSGVLHDHPSPDMVLEQLKLSSSVRALLTQIFQSDPKRRPSAWDLLHFEFFRLDNGLEDNDSAELTSLETSTPSLLAHVARSRRESSHMPASASRYSKDFTEDGRLGKGGFGEVFRVRNKVDGQLYAVKKVKARSRAALDPVLSEVTVLSRLNHPNVVRYFAAWIEDSVSNDGSETTGTTDGEYTSSIIDGNPHLPPSSRGLDFISSNNAQVIFANDDQSDGSITDEEDESQTESSEDSVADAGIGRRNDENDVHRSSRNVLPNTQGHTSAVTLYIQMEYCKQETLRDLIHSGLQSNDHEIWRLFRQIVQGLAHIHALSIVHRDLKPENIFIDSNGDVRIGDFGLARPGDYHAVKNRSNGTQNQGDIFGSFTKDVGTASYVAPEVHSASGKYDEKADMFSLGIVFLEMNVTFSTGMERAERLASLQNDGQPSVLDAPEKATQAKIFGSLIQHKPSQRPSSAELLSSGEIPVQAEDESLRMARRLLHDQKSHHRLQFINSLFSGGDEQAKNLLTEGVRDPAKVLALLNDHKSMSRGSTRDPVLERRVKDTLSSIFQRHGAVQRTDNPALFPYNAQYPIEDVVKFLDPGGKLVQLPYDLILSNAISLAHQPRADEETFIFDDVYRADRLGDQPKIFGEANFDIVSTSDIDLAVHEAQILKVIDEIIDAFPNFSSIPMCYHISHSLILNSILRFCSIEPAKWPAVKEIISKLHTGDWTWGKVRHELRAPAVAVAALSLDELERFDFRDILSEAIPKLRAILKDMYELDAVFAHLELVMRLLVRLGVSRKVYLNPLSSYNEKFYQGNILFQCLYDQKKRSVFAAGGRYDALVQAHQPILSKRNRVHVVGFQMAWTSLCADVNAYLKKISRAKSKSRKKSQAVANAAWDTTRCDVLVDCFDRTLLETVGMEILRELWASDISAKFSKSGGDSARGNTFVKDELVNNQCSWIILIKSEDYVRVSNTDRDDETEIRLSELSTYMRSEVRERFRREERTTRASLLREGSQQESESVSKDRDLDIKVLTSQNKGKKVNRKTIVEEAQTYRGQYLRSCIESPIIAIETKDDIFDGISETRLSDSESWRKFVQAAAPGERQYLGQLQEMLKTTAKESIQSGNTTAFIYNFRTKRCIPYNLGRVSG